MLKGRLLSILAHTKEKVPFIFFARGAKKVIALEPCQSFYEQALDTIKKNNLTESITVLNKGVGNSIRELDANRGGETETLFPVGDFMCLIEKLKEENSDIVLKIDCEGCEYELYRDSGQVLLWKNLGVKEFIMEYHDGDILSLLNNWRSNGFRVCRILKKSTNVGIIYGHLV